MHCVFNDLHQIRLRSFYIKKNKSKKYLFLIILYQLVVIIIIVIYEQFILEERHIHFFYCLQTIFGALLKSTLL